MKMIRKYLEKDIHFQRKSIENLRSIIIIIEYQKIINLLGNKPNQSTKLKKIWSK